MEYEIEVEVIEGQERVAAFQTRVELQRKTRTSEK